LTIFILCLFTSQASVEDMMYTVTYDEYILSQGNAEIVLTFGGDCVLASDRKDIDDPNSLHAYVKQKGMDWFFSGVKEVFEGDDLSMVNLECVLADDSTGYKKRQHNFRGLPEYTEILHQGSIEAVNVANNHHIDYTGAGKKSTIEALTNAGIRYSGYTHFDIFEKKGIKIGFGGIRETTYLQNKSQIKKEIQHLKDQGCNYIVYSLHFGKEYDKKHNELQEQMAHTAIDAGANLVVGTHTHVVQGVEKYNNGIILYSLGNLVFGGNHNLTEFDAVIAKLRLDFKNYVLKGTSLELIPIHTSSSFEYNDFKPVLAQGEAKQAILNRIAADSNIIIEEKISIY
ncbi:MAG: CapA family protein, partial [Eubacteriales bacterium]|nr:CapA family protein [Eubacteriales bacterium]